MPGEKAWVRSMYLAPRREVSYTPQRPEGPETGGRFPEREAARATASAAESACHSMELARATGGARRRVCAARPFTSLHVHVTIRLFVMEVL
mmetsp:Transcript_20365/g.69323  ORF Transcript_20365/g.69323 Transcript_20365/m.69323 type:complete len:92 (-) Transcript_20365:153-428(-)